MRDCRRRLLLLVLLAGPALCAGQDEGFEKAMYGKYLSPVESFGYIEATQYHSGRERREEHGLKAWKVDEEMSTFLRRQFKKNFADIPYVPVGGLNWTDNPGVGRLRCEIWLHGDSYPMAYHVACMLGAGARSRVLYDAALGITSRNDTDKTVKEAVGHMVSKFALLFFRARGDL